MSEFTTRSYVSAFTYPDKRLLSKIAELYLHLFIDGITQKSKATKQQSKVFPDLMYEYI